MLAQRDQVFWTGASGGYRWRFTSRDITAARAGREPFSLRKQRFPKGQDMEGLTFYGSNATPLSIVGPILSYRENDYWEGGAHPSGSIGYTSLDVSRPGRRLQLTDLFPDAQVRDALWADRVVRGTLSKHGVTRKPATAKALAKALEFKHFGGEAGETYSFSGDLLTQFAFHHLEGEKVAVRLNVSWGAEIYRFRSTEIGVLLPVPPSLRGPLRSAASGRQGFLTRHIQRRFEDRSATLMEKGGERSGQPRRP